MANRVVLDSNGIRVSQPGDNVLSPSEPLIFDSRKKRTGEVYSGGSKSSISGSGFNWSSIKGALGYIPMIIASDDDIGDSEIDDGSSYETTTRTCHYETTTTHLIPESLQPGERNSSSNAKFMVLRIPLQYGKMTDTSLWD